MDHRYTRPDYEYGDELTTLGHAQLIAQVTASAGLDTQAVGIMAVDVALAAVVVGVRGTAYVWVAALVFFIFSAGWAVQPLLVEGPEIGQALRESLDERATFTDGELRNALFSSVVAASDENRSILTNKTNCVGRAIRWTAAGILLATVGKMF